MVRQATPLVILGIAFVVGLTMCIAGSAIDKCWYSVFILIPALFSAFTGYGFFKQSTTSTEGGLIGPDGFIFLFAASMTSMFALPIVLWHVNTIRGLSLGLTLGGCAVITIGVILNVIFSLQEDGESLCGGDDF